MTVVLGKKPEKQRPPAVTKREAKELKKINPQPAKDRRKALKRKERLIRQLGKYWVRCGGKLCKKVGKYWVRLG